MKTKEIKITILSVTLLFFGIAGYSQAATLYFNPSTIEVGVDEEFRIDLYIDTEGEDVNALEVELTYPKEYINFVDSFYGSSIVTFWIEKPQRENGKVIFSGAIPGGFSGTILPDKAVKVSNGFISSFIFRPKKEGVGEIQFSDARVLLNDGEATEVDLTLESASINISSEENKTRIPISDQNPPEIKTAFRYKSDVFDGKYVLIFSAVDKESGVSHFEIKERGGEFVRAESPYLLEVQKPGSDITLKSVDRAGNSSTIIIEGQDNGKYEILLTFLFILLFLGLLWVTKSFSSRNLSLINKSKDNEKALK